mgnify:CR=1 FL=1
MKINYKKVATYTLFYFPAALFLSLVVFSRFFVINYTESLPTGIYTFSNNLYHLKEGDTVTFDYKLCCKIKGLDLPLFDNFMKNITGVEGDKLYYKDEAQTILILEKKDGTKKEFEMLAESFDGQKLPKIKPTTIGDGYFFLTTPAERSFDSRYYGLVHRTYMKHKADLFLEIDFN